MSPEELIKQTVTVNEAAKLLGISRATAYQLANEGKLPGARRLGRRIVVSRKALELFLEDTVVEYSHEETQIPVQSNRRTP